MGDNTNLSLAELQEALKRDAIGVDEKPIEVPLGDDLTKIGKELRGEEIPADVPEEVSTEQIDAEPQSTESYDEGSLKYLDNLENTFVKGKVNGEEREYSIAELLAIRQTQDAAKQKLDEYKTLLREARESLKDSQPVTPAAEPEEEYMTDEERKIRLLEAKLNSLETNQNSFVVNQLAEAEERHMRQVFERDGLTEAQAAQRIKAIVDNYPDAAQFAANLFTSNPTNRDDLSRRIATFNTLWQLNKTIEMPQVVQRVAQQARQEGMTDAKIQAKRNITNLSGGDSTTKNVSREDRIKQAAEGGQDSDWANLLLEGPVFRNL